MCVALQCFQQGLDSRANCRVACNSAVIPRLYRSPSKSQQRFCHWTHCIPLCGILRRRFANAQIQRQLHVSPPSHSRCALLDTLAPSTPCFGRFRCTKTTAQLFLLATTELEVHRVFASQKLVEFGGAKHSGLAKNGNHCDQSAKK